MGDLTFCMKWLCMFELVHFQPGMEFDVVLGTPSKKNVTNVTLGGGRQNVTFLQVVFKIHFKSF